MEAHNADIVRYLQCGVEDEAGFTGHIYDYAGGGQYQDFYFLKGENLDCDPDGEPMDDDAFAAIIEEVYPGLMEAIDSFEALYAVFTLGEGFFFRKATDFFKTKQKGIPNGMMFVEGASPYPITVGNTRFEEVS